MAHGCANLATQQLIPSPNFSNKVVDSAINRPNIWGQVLQDRSQPYGVTKHKRDYDLPQEDWSFNAKSRGFDTVDRNQFPRQKVDKRDIEQCNYYCDTCDRGFKAEEQYTVHTDEHEKCRMKDCSYIAAPKLVKLHYNMQHATGLASKIKESSEDIQKWIQERRRNFPTVANVQRKREELRERQESGEVLETKQFGKMGRGRGRRNRGRNGRGRNQRFEPYNSHQSGRSYNTPADDSADPLSRLASGSVHTPSYIDHTAISGSQPTLSSPSNVGSAATPTVVGEKPKFGLGSLMASYGDVSSSEEGEITDPPALPDKQNTSTPSHTISSTPVSSNSTVTAATETTTTLLHHADTSRPSQRQRQQEHNRGRHGKTIQTQKKQQQRSMQQCKSSLLEKLLAGEIRHERNVLLQCVRHVVQEQFFGIGQEKAEVRSQDYSDEWE